MRHLEESLARLHQRDAAAVACPALRWMAVATVLLWEPAMQASVEGLGAAAGLLSAAVGSYLLIRA